jgi:hypothetical protein
LFKSGKWLFYFHFWSKYKPRGQGLKLVNLTLDLTVKMEGFFKKYESKLNEKSVVVENGCRIWQGCQKKGPIGYGVIKAKFPDGWHTVHAHRLRYLVSSKTLTLEQGYEVSHLCHKPLCIAFEHLSLEPHSVNTERLKCLNRGNCGGHDPFALCRLPQN